MKYGVHFPYLLHKKSFEKDRVQFFTYCGSHERKVGCITVLRSIYFVYIPRFLHV